MERPAGSESGWGINFAHQGDTIFATWFTYDVDGSPLWMVAAAAKAADSVYSGTLYRGTGPAFNATTFDPAQVRRHRRRHGRVHVHRRQQRDVRLHDQRRAADQADHAAGVLVARCRVARGAAQPIPALATNYQDLWWNAPAGSEAGWGINFTHQGDTIFATWFTYGVDGKPLWFAVTAVLTAPKVYAGTSIPARGPPSTPPSSIRRR